VDIKAVEKTVQVIAQLEAELKVAHATLRKLVEGKSLESALRNGKKGKEPKASGGAVEARMERGAGAKVAEWALAQKAPFSTKDVATAFVGDDVNAVKMKRFMAMVGRLVGEGKIIRVSRGRFFRPLKKGEKAPEALAEE
jgi:hypothetical protein